jgi:TraM recognition site of TraD and TraG
VQDEQVLSYWQEEFTLLKGLPHAPILTRLNTFLRSKLIRNMVAQKKDKLDMRAIMDGRKILLAKLSQGGIGEENAHLLGSLLVAKIAQAAMSRQDEEAADRVPFFLYMDEFHHFMTPSIATILSAARKYGLGLTLAHQEMRQLKSRSEEVASAVLGNVYTRVVFRVGEQDAKSLADGFSFFDWKDLQNLGTGEAIARIERPDFDFNLNTLSPDPAPEVLGRSWRSEVEGASRLQFARPRAEIEAELRNSRGRREKVGDPELPIPRTSPKSPRERPDPPEHESVIGLPGRGGAEHKYLQSLIRRLGEERGFTVTVEKPVLGGHGHVDVALGREDCSIGCEISMSTRAVHEAGNMAKLVAAGFDYAVLVTSKERVRRAAREALGDAESSRLRFLSPEGFVSFLDELAPVAGRRKRPGRARTAEPAAERPPSGLIGASRAAAYMGLKPQTLAKMRVYGTSPPFHKVGSRVLYNVADLDAWLLRRRRRSTSDATPN